MLGVDTAAIEQPEGAIGWSEADNVTAPNRTQVLSGIDVPSGSFRIGDIRCRIVDGEMFTRWPLANSDLCGK